MSEQYYDTDDDSLAEVAVVDTDADGTLDTAFVDVDEDSNAEVAVVDTDQDGVFDTALIDTDEDSIVDTVVVDADEDGNPDAVLWAEPDAGVEGENVDASASDGVAEGAGEDGGQSLTTPPDDVTNEDLAEASNDLTAQTAINAGMADTYRAMDAQYG